MHICKHTLPSPLPSSSYQAKAYVLQFVHLLLCLLMEWTRVKLGPSSTVPIPGCKEEKNAALLLVQPLPT